MFPFTLPSFGLNINLNSTSDDSDDVVKNKDCEKIVQIDANADGSCFLHAILKCSHPDYQKAETEKERQEIAYEIRKDLVPMLREPNPNYPTLESVVKFVKRSLLDPDNKKELTSEEKGIRFKGFLQTAYSFDYISYPSQMKFFTNEYFESLEEVYSYVASYREYLVKFDEYLKDGEFPIFKEISKKKIEKEDVEIYSLNDDMQNFITALKEVHENLSKKVNEKYYNLQIVLSAKLGNELYNPQNFGVPYVQTFLKGEELPKGLYHFLPYNCYFFTANSGVLTRFAYYPEKLIPGLEDLEEILNNTRKFLGDMDIVPYIPGMLDLNIIVINFTENQLVTEYSSEETQNHPWVVIINNNNAHYDACGYTDEDEKLITLFNKEDDFIYKILSSKENQGKIDWNKEKSKEKEISYKVSYETMTVSQLKEVALQKNIKITTTMKKGDIIKKLKEN